MILTWHITCICSSPRVLLIRVLSGQTSTKGSGISSPWGRPARTCIHELEKVGRWCELRHAVVADIEDESRQNTEQCSRRRGESSPSELSVNRASRMVAVGSSRDHHTPAHPRTSFIPAPKFVIGPGLRCLICFSASRARARGARFLVRSLHDLSASANSPHSPATDRTRGAFSFDQ